MAKAKRARRNSFRTMSGDGALEALEMIERVAGPEEPQAENEAEAEAEGEDRPRDESEDDSSRS